MLKLKNKSVLMAGFCIFSSSVIAAPAFAQAAPSDEDAVGIQEIIVTAQKREQSLQDVPIAVTALTSESLQANRVTSVGDLSGLAPNLTVRSTAGSIGVPTITMRGLTSYGVVPGSDKQVSMYVDGVYIGSTRGSMFDLPDIARIEVLRGPQGTLFGRNATAGAISIVTRDPTGEIGAKQQFTIGNYGQFRVRTTVDLPQVGPFSAYVSFVHDKRRGDTRNLGAGTVWDRTGPLTGLRAAISPRYLGNKDANNWFAALKFQPSDTFHMTYKYDHAVNHDSPEATSFIYSQADAANGIGALVTALLASNNYTQALNMKAPSAVNNGWTIPGHVRTSGHTLTSELQISDSLSLKNVTAFRKAYQNSAAQLDGLGGLVLTQSALPAYAAFARSTPENLQFLVGSRFNVTANANQTRSKQFSNELQLNYDSKMLTLTVGALYFHQKDEVGAPKGIANTFSFTTLPTTGRLPLGKWATSFVSATSVAAYTQAELHLTPQLDIVGGARITRDKKTGYLASGGTFALGPNGYIDGTYTGVVEIPTPHFVYKKSKPNFAVSVNYRPNPDTMVYGKFSTAFVSGGSVGGIDFQPETVSSIEFGAKVDLFDRRLRTNLAIFDAKYKNQQSAQSGTNIGRRDLSTVVIDAGDRHAKGFELEVTALPVTGLTLTGGLGYSDIKLSNVTPLLITLGGGKYEVSGIPKWTANVSAQYESPTLGGSDMRLVLRMDGTWHSNRQNMENPDVLLIYPALQEYSVTEASWIVNGRIALRDIPVGPAKVEVAGWVRNLGNNREPSYPLRLGSLYSSTFLPARTYGLDLTFAF